tara:strand:+ start:5743 stop:7149 length:1407 start_codon:yes stop_codon:yes gene_type:complete
VNSIKKFINLKNRFVDHSEDIRDGDTFISIKNGYSNLSADLIEKADYILLTSPGPSESKKFVNISELKEKYIKDIEEIYGLKENHFNKFFVTGTNGKTSTIHFLRQILNFSESSCASTGTLGRFINNKFYGGQRLTTETPIFIRNFLRECEKNSVQNILFEASSIGIEEKRLSGLSIDHAALSNISRDHLNYHGNIENYVDAKLKLVKSCKQTFTYVKQDQLSERIKNSFKGNALYSISIDDPKSDISIKVKKIFKDGIIEFTAETPWGNFQNGVKLFAEYNLLNLFLGLPFFLSCSKNIDLFSNSLNTLRLPNGRMQLFEKNEKRIFVDFAHTPDAIKKTLINIKKTKPRGLILVLGAGGDQDQGKRAEMGEIAENYADYLIVTSDNPRFEDPDEISKMITSKISKDFNFEIENDRGKAIKKAFKNLKEYEVLVIAGKGHEDYQIVGNNKEYFSDVEEVRKCLELLD